jgi:molybdenum cofactor cytidylyltransferase
MIPAIVPAAGRSERMGRPKLILPIGGTTVIARLVRTLVEGGAEPVVVVTPPLDAPGAAVLADEARSAGAIVVVAAERPADMRASFELGIVHLGGAAPPAAVLLAPADSLGISAEVAAAVIACARANPTAIVIPACQGQRGHPIALPWPLAAQTRALPLGAGINALVALHAAEVIELPVADTRILDDLDTPDDYRRYTET